MQLSLRMPLTMQLSTASELATLALFEAAATATEALLCSIHDPLGHGIPDPRRHPRSAASRAFAVIRLCRRLSAALAAYREALDRDARRRRRQLLSDKPF